jgi:uncharacterized protein (TIGR02611 family)
MKRLVKYARKIAVALAGTVVLIIGIILIPLPGPGLLVCVAALFIFSLEFERFKPHAERVKKLAKNTVKKPK